MSTLSVDDQRALDALRSAVTEALERKRRLGEYHRNLARRPGREN